MPRIIAISNQKGGVGKSTTAANLGAALARAGHATLLVDLDPQGNATTGLGVARATLEHGTSDAMLGLQPIAACLAVTSQERLHLLPADRDLAGMDVELAGAPDRERRLAASLADLPAGYDFVLIDCPPSLGLSTLNALVAADGVLIPVQAEYHAMEGLGDLVRTITAVRRGSNPRLVREGIVITLADARTNLCREVERQARDVFGREVFDTVIPRAVRLAEAPGHGQTIFAYAPGSRPAHAYEALAQEFVRRTVAARRRATA